MKGLIAAICAGFAILLAVSIRVAVTADEGLVDDRYFERGARYFADAGNVHAGPVAGTGGGVTVRLDISPKPVRAMRPLEFTAASDAAGEGPGRIELAMPGMAMPPNRIPLAKGPDGAFRGTGTIVRCMSGCRTWTATVMLPGTPPVAVTFDVAD